METTMFEEWLQYEIETYNWAIEKGFLCRKIDNYEIEVRRDSAIKKIAVRMKGMTSWFIFNDTALADIEKLILDKLPYINSIHFYEYVASPIIIA